jgi:cytochrome P450 family 6
MQVIKMMVALMVPDVARYLNLELMDKEGTDFMVGVIGQAMPDRKGQTKKRNDMVDLVMDALQIESGREELEVDKPTSKMSEIDESKFEVLVISNLLLLFFAGFDTSSAMMAACLHLVAMDQDVQDRLCQEIADAVEASQTGEELNYNVVQTLPYLDMVVHESMRHYPIADIERKCTKEYTIPGTNCTILKGMLVQMSASGIMFDEQYFPNPTKFDPEHFSPESKAARSPYAYVVFGLGPRNCVGIRLALLQFKICLARMVYNYRIMPTEKSPEKLEVDPMSINTDVKGGIWVKVEKRNKSQVKSEADV